MRGRSVKLVALDWTRPKDPPMSLGHASIVVNLRKHNIAVDSKSWAVNRPDFSFREVVSSVMHRADKNTDVAFGAFVWNERPTQQVIHALRELNFPGNIIIGGPQVSYVKNGLQKYYPGVDIFVRGYGEDALAKLYLSDEEKPTIAGISYRDEPDLGISANVELEKLPSPYLTGLIKPQRFIRWETQRGCPFRCSFCQHRESDITMTRRNMPLLRVMQEAEWITNNRIIKDIAVLDPTFNSGPHYLEVMAKLIAGKYSGKLALQCRLEMVTPEFIEKIKELNKTANVVLEFGLQTIHSAEQRIIQRPNNMTKVREILKITKESNIATELSLIFGLPNQTVSSFKESVAFCKEMGVKVIHAFPLMLLRGTPLYDNKQSLGLIESSDIHIPEIDRIQGDGDIPHVVSSPSFNFSDWQKMAEIAKGLENYNKFRLFNRVNDQKMGLPENLRLSGRSI